MISDNTSTAPIPPLAATFFDRQACRSAGDLDCGAIYKAVGYALHRWESSETSFATLFTALLSPTGGTSGAFRAYGVVMAGATRRQMIEAVAETFFQHFPSTALQAELKRILNIYQVASGRRNDIAHGTVMGDVAQSPPHSTQWYLVPPLHATLKQGIVPLTDQSYKYNSSIIINYASGFERLGPEAFKFCHDVRLHFQSQPAEFQARY